MKIQIFNNLKAKKNRAKTNIRRHGVVTSLNNHLNKNKRHKYKTSMHVQFMKEHKKRNRPASFLTSSLRLLRFRAQSAMVEQPSESVLVSGKSEIISILRTRSEKLLSSNANPKSESTSPGENSESIIFGGSQRTPFDIFMPKDLQALALTPSQRNKWWKFYLVRVSRLKYGMLR